METNNLKKYSLKLSQTIDKIKQENIDILIDNIEKCYKNNKKVFIIGNGGSAANASHLAEDLAQQIIGKKTKEEIKTKYSEKQKKIKVISLTDNTPQITALANDFGYENIFIEQLKNLAEIGDLLIAISGSGNSPNVLKAIDWANNNELKTCGITGFNGGRLKNKVHINIHVPINDMYITESVHLVIFHYIIDKLKQIIK